MKETLQRFGEQFTWEPSIEHSDVLRSYERYVVCGMGGSHLGAWLLKRYGHAPNIVIHRDYGLPELSEEDWKNTLVILSSYSGNTEEVLDSGRKALSRNLPLAAISVGGELLEFAKGHNLPYIQIPDLGLEPRMAIGFSMLGIARLIQRPDIEESVRDAGKAMDPFTYQQEGERLAALLEHKTPSIFASASNTALAYLWKIKLNETAKIPAYMNVFPELSHNELCGLDVADTTRSLSSSTQFLMLRDTQDNQRIQKRMDVAKELLTERGMQVERIELEGTGFSKIFATSFLADWTAFTLAELYGVPALPTPLIVEFKERITK